MKYAITDTGICRRRPPQGAGSRTLASMTSRTISFGGLVTRLIYFGNTNTGRGRSHLPQGAGLRTQAWTVSSSAPSSPGSELSCL